MRGHNICFHLEIRNIISESSLILPLICSFVCTRSNECAQITASYGSQGFLNMVNMELALKYVIWELQRREKIPKPMFWATLLA